MDILSFTVEMKEITFAKNPPWFIFIYKNHCQTHNISLLGKLNQNIWTWYPNFNDCVDKQKWSELVWLKQDIAGLLKYM